MRCSDPATSDTLHSLLVRLLAGPLCDRFGPRRTFAGCLIAGAIPTFCAGGIKNASGLYAIRFFVGILGGSFVPCQVWTTGFFDKNVVGTANAFTGGLGNLGGGITYFVMPHVYVSLVKDGLTPHVAWRVAFIVPGVVIVSAALALLLLCPDTPNGKWEDRFAAAEANLLAHTTRSASTAVAVVDVPGHISADEKPAVGITTPTSSEKEGIKFPSDPHHYTDHEAQLGEQEMVDTARGEVIQKPSLSEFVHVLISPQTIVLGAAYFNSFGAELAINSILGTYYAKNFPKLSLEEQGNWAAMFGLLNGITRPLGGVVSDFVYGKTHSTWAKKLLIHSYGLITGMFLIIIGVLDSKHQAAMFGLIAGLAFFLEGGNGTNFSLVPHVHPYANGIVSGFTGACGNFGGIVFAIIFRYNGTNYGKVFWIMGVIGISMNLALSWIRPIPKGQIGGQ